MAETVSRKSIIMDILLDFKKGKKTAKEAADSLGNVDKKANQLTSTLKKVGAAFGLAFGISEIARFTTEAVKLAAAGEGVRKAFDRLNDPTLLVNLRKATRGTVTDLELMRQAVRAENFKIPLENLGKFFEFASKRARDTGESVDYLVTSIIDGIGRKSSLVLDNLGISASRLQEEIRLTGDFAQAASNIISEELGNSGDVINSTADKVDILNVSFQNLKETIGRRLLPLLNPLFAGLVDVFDKISGNTEEAKLFYELSLAAEQYNKNLNDLLITTPGLTSQTIKLTKAGEELLEQYRDFVKLRGGNEDPADFLNMLTNAVNSQNKSIEGLTNGWFKVGDGLFRPSIDDIITLTDEFHDLNDAIGDNSDTLKQFLEDMKKLREIMAKTDGELFPVPDEEINEKEVNYDKFLDDRKEKSQELRDAQNELAESTINLATNSLAAAGLGREAAKLEVAFRQAQAIAAGIEAAVKAGAKGGVAAPFLIASNIALILASIIGGFSQMASFAEGTEYLDDPNAPHGRDTIPIMADRGEAIIPTRKNRERPGLAKAWISGTLDDYIQTNYIDPAMLNVEISERQEQQDYSNRFYKQLLATNEGNHSTKKMVHLLYDIKKNTSYNKIALKYTR